MDNKIKAGDRVKCKHDWFPVGGIVKKVYPNLGVIVKFDKKLPNEYVWETDTTLMFTVDLEKE